MMFDAQRRSTMFDKLLLPIDGSDASIAAAEPAIALARLAGAPITIVFVLEPYPYAGIGAARKAAFDEYIASGHAWAAQAFERVVKAANAQGVTTQTMVVEHTEPARGIAEAARSLGVGLIVMGSRGRTGMAKLMLGSVASKVLSLSTVPVLIIK
jgi:nucleotide-binding universal stress UspA family protein